MEAPHNGKQQQSTEEGKIFVGGLSWETTKDTLRAHFEQFGKVLETVVMIDNVNKKPRGFGFVTFEDPACVDSVMNFSRKQPNEQIQHHIIDGKQVDPKPAYLKGGSTEMANGKKIFVGGIGHDVIDVEVNDYFSQYGTVVDVDLKMDKGTNRKRGFAFVTFDDDKTVEKVIQIHFHQLKGKTVECKKAQPRNATQNKQQMPQQYYGNTAPYGGYAATAPDWNAGAAGGYGMYPQQQPQQQQYAQQQPYGTGNYMRGGYPPQNTTGGYPMGRGEMHNPSAPPTGVPHQGHMTQGYGRGHDATSYPSGPGTGYGQAATAGGGAYGAAQSGYNYESMPQVGTQPTASPYGTTPGYGDTAANAGYPGAPPQQHKPQKTSYNTNYY